MSAKESKTERIDVRTTVAAKQLLQQAAEVTLADRRLFVLDDDRWQAFQATLV